MPDIPEEAVQAVMGVLLERRLTPSKIWAEPFAREILAVAAPVLAAQVRQQVAEELLALADVKRAGYDPARFDAFLKEYGLVYHPRMRDTLKAAAHLIGGGDQ
ncbi:hypothetical protein [Nonomuraea rubra]|uniref:Uncharacterized protein n=1 Tax=Nonomuraea rubra TaxID=46180 RepID=A0A7X0P6Y2_9ACTN|nr:hypothetical protein [Nonomuraea rubra]MBB6556192.1 hypothetical protein [Nonomuraea rubra]